jgi:hypothetical protein
MVFEKRSRQEVWADAIPLGSQERIVSTYPIPLERISHPQTLQARLNPPLELLVHAFSMLGRVEISHHHSLLIFLGAAFLENTCDEKSFDLFLAKIATKQTLLSSNP